MKWLYTTLSMPIPMMISLRPTPMIRALNPNMNSSTPAFSPRIVT